jgi:hypothetical protein
MASFTQWNPPPDHRLNLFVTKQIEQHAQIYTKPCWFPPFQILNAVGENSPSARREESAQGVPRRPQYAAKSVAQTTCQLTLFQK